MNSVDHHKFAETVLYLLTGCGGERPGLTKLLKMLYFADFGHYREHLTSITNATYAAVERGPVPDNYEALLDHLEQGGLVKCAKIPQPDGGEKAEYSARRGPDRKVFSPDEIATLDAVIEQCKLKSGNALSEWSHLEGPWSLVWDANEQGRAIPYVLARWLDNRCDAADKRAAALSLTRNLTFEKETGAAA